MPQAQKYDPTNPTPYQPYQAPQPPPQEAAPAFIQQPGFQFTGAPNTALGNVAGALDNVFRGYMRGKFEGDARKLMQMKAKTDNLQNSYNQDAKILFDMAQSGVAQDSQEFKQAVSAVQGSWGALQDWESQHVNGEDTTTGKRRKTKSAQKASADPMADLKSEDPNVRAQALYALRQKMGPPVLWQVRQFYTPEAQSARKAQEQAAQNAVTETQAGQLTAQQKLEEAKQALRYAQIAGKQEKEWSPEDKQFVEQYDSMHGKASDELIRQKAAVAQKVIDDPNYEPTPSEQMVLSGGKPPGGTPPKVGSFGDFMRQAYGDQPTAQQYEQGRKLWAQSGASETVGTHMIEVPQPDGSIKSYQVQTTSQKVFPGASPPPAGAGAQGGASQATSLWIGSPKLPPLFVLGGNPGKIPGMKEPGNVNIMYRPNVPNPETGGDSSVWSTSFGTDQGEVLVPRITAGEDGKPPHILSDQKVDGKPSEAEQYYRKYGKFLGIFDTPEHATAYAQKLHQQQARLGQMRGSGNSPGAPPAHAAHQSAPASSPASDGVAHPGETIGGHQTPQATKAIELADSAETAYEEAKARAKAPTPIGDTGIVLNWVKAQIAGAGRMNNLEVEQGLKSGSFGTRYSNAYHRAVDGTLDATFRRQMVDDIGKYAAATQKEAEKYRQPKKFTVTDPNGTPHEFDTQEQAGEFQELIKKAQGH